jgi:phosphoglucomutase
MPSAVTQLSGVSPLAGRPAPKELLIDVARLEREYYVRLPDLADPNQLVSFGTSGHRGCPFHGTFTEAHVLAISQALCDYRKVKGIDGPLYIGKDTHALSGPAQRTALEVLAANRVETVIQAGDGVTPTPLFHGRFLYITVLPRNTARTVSWSLPPTTHPRMEGLSTTPLTVVRQTQM